MSFIMDLEQLCINIGKGEMIMNSQENLSLQAHQVIREVQKAVIGKEECIRKVMMAILSSGHILLEDIPGVGKTTMALAFSKALNLKENRLTFTPDVLPADLTGFTMYRKETGKFYYQPCFGCREFPAQFKACELLPPCPDELKGERDLGWMLWDMDYSDPENILPLFFRAALRDGVLEVPTRDSGEVRG